MVTQIPPEKGVGETARLMAGHLPPDAAAAAALAAAAFFFMGLLSFGGQSRRHGAIPSPAPGGEHAAGVRRCHSLVIVRGEWETQECPRRQMSGPFPPPRQAGLITISMRYIEGRGTDDQFTYCCTVRWVMYWMPTCLILMVRQLMRHPAPRVNAWLASINGKALSAKTQSPHLDAVATGDPSLSTTIANQSSSTDVLPLC